MLEISEAVQQLLNRSNAEVVQEVAFHEGSAAQKAGRLNKVTEGGIDPLWKITYDTQAN